MQSASDSDDALVRRVGAGDAVAFRVLIERHQRMVERMVARLVDNRSDREEVAQDTFHRVYRGAANFRGDAPVGAWIAQIAHRCAIDHLKKSRRSERPLVEEEKERFGDSPDQQLASNEVRAIMQREISALPAIQKSVITLYHLQGMSIGDIATALEQPSGTIKSHLFRARLRLKEEILKQYSPEELVL
jgi:RNA polymerase sigma-70 factor, ECF subfamily